jgi:peptidyl-prolyl cis-trans isomerase SurA
MRRVFAVVMIALALGAATSYGQTAPVATSRARPVVLDRVVAVINRQVLLQSDVDAEMHFAALEPLQAGESEDTPLKAINRLIDRVLLLQQMNEQQFNPNISDADVEKSLLEQRAHLSGFGKYSCLTEEGWNAFLAAHDLTNQEVVDHWRERMAILRFVDQRFRSGIRISQASVADYYATSVVPGFAQKNEAAPPLKALYARIQELLLQKQMNGMLQTLLNNLRDESNVQIVDPEYASAVKPASGTDSASPTGVEE